MRKFMMEALKEAQKAEKSGSVPIGAVIVENNKIISRSGNKVIRNCDPTAHAEILAIRRACSFLNSRIINECDIFVTLEPCPMCAHAISLARIRRVYFGAYNLSVMKSNSFASSQEIVGLEIIGGVLETQCAKILQNFFDLKRS
ncbi:MAG: nucleoside deaminase [Holosporaceae bacterium]|jgi:tRNA(Arg) A34 adenosine deaminase TadA|nr:nucleoside deaminase [Holosporaceae bacterium]